MKKGRGGRASQAASLSSAVHHRAIFARSPLLFAFVGGCCGRGVSLSLSPLSFLLPSRPREPFVGPSRETSSRPAGRQFLRRRRAAAPPFSRVMGYPQPRLFSEGFILFAYNCKVGGGRQLEAGYPGRRRGGGSSEYARRRWVGVGHGTVNRLID